ncbi:putative ATP synthase protein YMF19, partial [Bienertia sinuspersici]
RWSTWDQQNSKTTKSNAFTSGEQHSKKKITLIPCFGEISSSRGMESNIFYLISKSSYSNPGWVITCKNDIMLIHVLTDNEI